MSKRPSHFDALWFLVFFITLAYATHFGHHVVRFLLNRF